MPAAVAGRRFRGRVPARMSALAGVVTIILGIGEKADESISAASLSGPSRRPPGRAPAPVPAFFVPATLEALAEAVAEAADLRLLALLALLALPAEEMDPSSRTPKKLPGLPPPPRLRRRASFLSFLPDVWERWYAASPRADMAAGGR
jgi:hypothetical protein